MKKTWTASALSLALIVSAAGPAFASTPFQDIGGSGAKQQIEALQAKGIVSGVTDEQFAPGERLLLSQGIAMITRGLPASAPAGDGGAASGTAFFTSVPAASWYAASFESARLRGLDLPAEANPAETMTKEQFVHYVVQAMESTHLFPLIKLSPAEIADGDELTAGYQGTVQRALHYDLVALDESGRFHPQSQMTREEAAAILYRAC
ncbi:S-layer homology domain-containing protein [Paenibacillus doosanensis]|uniref:S-layer homology domain-containing protein n=1 Tax=Paenibacillus doosanensis TaxID=1229154 RepID=UPI002180313E|nr:S-layer homology domain-containing protein [Paenibacillus doosanensis]MCS7463831.1 S-layer homology domain-containing protein [Paenibacillus doosanensis]